MEEIRSLRPLQRAEASVQVHYLLISNADILSLLPACNTVKTVSPYNQKSYLT